MSAEKCCLPRHGMVIVLMKDHASENSGLGEGGLVRFYP